MTVGHQCDGPVTVEIHNASNPDVPEEIVPPGSSVERDKVGIPVFEDGITLYERKDGPTAISRRAEVDFPLQGLGDTWIDYIDAYQEEGGIQRATVKMTPQGFYDNNLELPPEILGEDTDPDQAAVERAVLEGYISAVGANGGNTGHLTIMGPFKLLDSIPVGGTVNQTVGLPGIMSFFLDRFNEGQPYFEDVDYIRKPIHELSGYELTPPEYLRLQNVHFSSNRDTLADVIETFQKRLPIRTWFEPAEGDTVELRVHQFGTDQEVPPLIEWAYDATEDGSIDILENNALYQMRPFNTVVVKGKAGLEIDAGPFGAISTATGAKRYPEAKARYEPLVERAGGQEIPVVVNSKKSTQSGVEAEALSHLRERLSNVSGGIIEVPLSPFISPFDVIKAKPGCQGKIDTDLPALFYEVERTAHKVHPNNPENAIPSSELAVSMAIDDSRISVESTTKTTEPSKGTDNEPQDDGDDGGILDWAVL